jgi:Xaa-Pro aminopeptidase
MPVESRLAALRDRLVAESADAIAIASVPNLVYCTGFGGVFDEEPAHLGLVSECGAVLITDSRYFEAVERAARGSEWRVVCTAETLVSAISAEVSSARFGRVALETTLPHSRFRALEVALESDVIEASGWVEEIRVAKDDSEIASMAAAQALTERAFDHVLERVIRAGVSERELALELEFFMRRAGSEGVAFPPIVASGPNSALPHAIPSERLLRVGDFVVLDFGARVDGYCADMTRTVVVGRASDRQREVYSAVEAASGDATTALHAQMTGAELDAVARRTLEGAGLARYFGHGLGHGVGLEVHELPRVGPRADTPIPAGAVITIEPGVYIPEFGGVRIENLAVVNESGAEVLTRADTALLEV